jgi:hypothetical protein
LNATSWPLSAYLQRPEMKLHKNRVQVLSVSNIYSETYVNYIIDKIFILKKKEIKTIGPISLPTSIRVYRE